MWWCLLIKKCINEKDNDGWDSLLIAINYNHLDIVKYLCTIGANFKVSNFYGENSLQNAVRINNLDIVKYLIQGKRADRKKTNLNGENYLQIASYYDNFEIIYFLSSNYTKNTK